MTIQLGINAEHKLHNIFITTRRQIKNLYVNSVATERFFRGTLFSTLMAALYDIQNYRRFFYNELGVQAPDPFVRYEQMIHNLIEEQVQRFNRVSILNSFEQEFKPGVVSSALALILSTYLNDVEAPGRKKQAIATLDSRTTDVCRNVHLTIVPWEEPFKLRGVHKFAPELHASPFYYNCRTVVIIL